MECYFTNQKNGNNLLLDADDTNHIVKVLRHKLHDEIVVIYQAQKYLTTIIALQPHVVCEIKELLVASASELACKITLVMALLKEQKFDLVIQKAVELGVSRIVPLQLQRCVSVLTAQRAAQKVVRWQNIAKAAAKQAQRNVIPLVTPVIFKVNDLKPYQSAVNLVADEEATSISWTQHIKRGLKEITIVIGPEGGITREEIAQLITLGFTKISLGKLILRAETAPLFLISIINYETNLRFKE